MTARGVVADSLRFALSQYLSRAVILARGLVAAAALGPAGFGAWNALVLILDYGSYASLGALYGLDLELPPAVASRDEPRAGHALRGAWGLTLAGGALFAVVVVAYLSAGTPGAKAGSTAAINGSAQIAPSATTGGRSSASARWARITSWRVRAASRAPSAAAARRGNSTAATASGG